MYKRLAVVSFLLFSMPHLALSKTTKAECTLTYKDKTGSDKTESVQLQLDDKGKIIPWDETKWGVPSKDAYWFHVFGEDMEAYGFEWTNSFKARNGYSILELGTTADAFKIGVNLEEGKGFYTYSDYGSGAGDNGPLDTTCKEI